MTHFLHGIIALMGWRSHLLSIHRPSKALAVQFIGYISVDQTRILIKSAEWLGFLHVVLQINNPVCIGFGRDNDRMSIVPSTS